MIDFQVNPESVDAVDAHMEDMSKRILKAIHVGMQESMEALAWTVADKLQGNPIMSHTGELLGAVLNSPRVTETPTVIRGKVSAFVGGKPLGIWLEEGTHVPAVAGNLFGFFTPGGEQIFTRGHKAFSVEARPFLNPSLQESKQQIMDTIRARVAEAIAE